MFEPNLGRREEYLGKQRRCPGKRRRKGCACWLFRREASSQGRLKDPESEGPDSDSQGSGRCQNSGELAHNQSSMNITGAEHLPARHLHLT